MERTLVVNWSRIIEGSTHYAKSSPDFAKMHFHLSGSETPTLKWLAAITGVCSTTFHPGKVTNEVLGIGYE